MALQNSGSDYRSLKRSIIVTMCTFFAFASFVITSNQAHAQNCGLTPMGDYICGNATLPGDPNTANLPPQAVTPQPQQPLQPTSNGGVSAISEYQQYLSQQQTVRQQSNALRDALLADRAARLAQHGLNRQVLIDLIKQFAMKTNAAIAADQCAAVELVTNWYKENAPECIQGPTSAGEGGSAGICGSGGAGESMGLGSIWGRGRYNAEPFIDFGQASLLWKQVQTAPGVYDFSILDRKLKMWHDLGKRATVQINGSARPDFLYNIVPYTFNSGAKTHQVIDRINGKPPVMQYWHPTYVKAHKDLLEAVGKHIENSPYKDAVLGYRFGYNRIGIEHSMTQAQANQATWVGPAAGQSKPYSLASNYNKAIHQAYVDSLINRGILVFTLHVDQDFLPYIEAGQVGLLSTGSEMEARYESDWTGTKSRYGKMRTYCLTGKTVCYTEPWASAAGRHDQIYDPRWSSPIQWTQWRILVDLSIGSSFITIYEEDFVHYMNDPAYVDIINFVRRYAGYHASPTISPGAWVGLREGNVGKGDRNFLMQRTSADSISPALDLDKGDRGLLGNQDTQYGAWARRLKGGATMTFEMNPEFASSLSGESKTIKITYVDSGGGSLGVNVFGESHSIAVGNSNKWKTAEIAIAAGNGDNNMSITANGSAVTIEMVEVVRDSGAGDCSSVNSGSSGGNSTGGNSSSGGTPSGPAKIVMIGDSILEQNAPGTPRYSWSFPLQDKLSSSCSGGYEIVGKPKSPYTGYIGPSGYDLDRIAVGGFNTSGILNWMRSEPPAFGSSTPDFVVSYLGVNNTLGGGWTSDGKGYNPAMSNGGTSEWARDMKDIISVARAANPNVTFVIVLLQDMAGINNGYKQKFDAINALASSVASSTTTANSSVHVTTQPRFVAKDLHDNVHPVRSGAEKIATVAYDTLFPAMNAKGYCGGTPSASSSSSSTNSSSSTGTPSSAGGGAYKGDTGQNTDTASAKNVYYISASGSDSNNGTSENSPLKSVAKAVSKAKDGDIFLLKRGDVFKETNIVHIDANNVTLGSYGSGERPVIDGQKRSEPGGHYDPQVKVTADNVIVENLSLQYSSGRGITVDDATGATLRNNFIFSPYSTGISCLINCKNAQILNNEIKEHNWAHGPSDQFSKDGGVGGWGQGITVRGGQNINIEGNYVHYGWGEGIGTFGGGDNITIVNNNVENSSRIQIYIDVASNVKVYGNNVTGSDDMDPRPGHGISINQEILSTSRAKSAGRSVGNKNIEIYENYIEGTRSGLLIMDQENGASYDDVNIHDNVFVDNDIGIQIYNSPKVNNLTITKNDFSAGGSGNKMASGDLQGSVNFSENCWSDSVGSKFSGSNDRTGGCDTDRPDAVGSSSGASFSGGSSSTTGNIFNLSCDYADGIYENPDYSNSGFSPSNCGICVVDETSYQSAESEDAKIAEDFENGSYDDNFNVQAPYGHQMEVVSSGQNGAPAATSGDKLLRVEVRSTDKQLNKRAELVNINVPMDASEPNWASWDVYFEKVDVPNDGDHMIAGQIFAGCTKIGGRAAGDTRSSSPAVVINIRNIGGKLYWNVSSRTLNAQNSVTLGGKTSFPFNGLHTWSNLSWEYKPSLGNDGYLRVFLNGTKIADQTGQVGCADSGKLMWKAGLYHMPGKDKSIAYLDDIQVGPGGLGEFESHENIGVADNSACEPSPSSTSPSSNGSCSPLFYEDFSTPFDPSKYHMGLSCVVVNNAKRGNETFSTENGKLKVVNNMGKVNKGCSESGSRLEKEQTKHRTELSPLLNIPVDEDVSVSFKMYITPESYRIGDNFMQATSTIPGVKTNPQILFQRIGGSRYAVNIKADGMHDLKMPVQFNKWTDWRIEYKLSDQNDGYVRVWVDGTQRLDYKGKTSTYNDRKVTKVKFGSYQGYATVSPNVDRVVYFDDVKIETGSGCRK